VAGEGFVRLAERGENDAEMAVRVGVTRVELRANGNLVASEAVAPFQFSWNTAGMANGSTTLSAVAFDAAGTLQSAFKKGATPYAAASGPAWQVYNKYLLATAGVTKPASQWTDDPYSMVDYDGLIVMALAATAAKSTSPAVWNASIPAVTTAPGEVVHSFAAGVAALHAGKKIDYVGAAGVIDFNRWHNSGGAFEIAAYQPSGDLVLVRSITAAQLVPLTK